MGFNIGEYCRLLVIKEETRSLDFCSYPATEKVNEDLGSSQVALPGYKSDSREYQLAKACCNQTLYLPVTMRKTSQCRFEGWYFRER